MLIVELTDKEPIDKALKRLKRKFDRSGVLRELRDRKQFTKPSVRRRNALQKAVYRQQRLREME